MIHWNAIPEKTSSISMAVLGTPKYQPYCMQPIPQSLFMRLANDKFLDGLQLVCTACLKSTGVMEDVSSVVREGDFIVDVVNATLSTGSSRSAVGEGTCGSNL